MHCKGVSLIEALTALTLFSVSALAIVDEVVKVRQLIVSQKARIYAVLFIENQLDKTLVKSDTTIGSEVVLIGQIKSQISQFKQRLELQFKPPGSSRTTTIKRYVYSNAFHANA